MAKQLDSSEYSRNNVERYHKRAARKGVRKGVVAVIVIALLAALGGTAFAAVNWVKSLDERLHNEEVVDDELRAVLTEPAAPSDPYYVLLLGTDGRAGEEDFRADTIILVRVDPPNKRLTMLSIPRDTHVYYKGLPKKFIAATVYTPEDEEIVEGAKVTVTNGTDTYEATTNSWGDF